MMVNGAPESSGEGAPREARQAAPKPPAANDIEAIFCPGDRIAGYEIEKVLGIGSLAVVYGAVQLSLGRHVALKVPLARLNRHPLFAQQFEREAGRVAALSHPNLVNILDTGRQGDLHYFVLEYVDGVPLETAIVRGILSYGDYLAVIRQIRESLKYIHGEGLAHLDVKPSNILLSRNGQVKLGDFAIARMALALGEEGSPAGRVYRAPELRARRPGVDSRADVYSLGITYHRMFCRAFPENGQARAAALNPALPKAVDGVLQEAIAPQADERYESVQRFTVELLSSLMGMAAFFQIDNIVEESEDPTNKLTGTDAEISENTTATVVANAPLGTAATAAAAAAKPAPARPAPAARAGESSPSDLIRPTPAPPKPAAAARVAAPSAATGAPKSPTVSAPQPQSAAATAMAKQQAAAPPSASLTRTAAASPMLWGVAGAALLIIACVAGYFAIFPSQPAPKTNPPPSLAAVTPAPVTAPSPEPAPPTQALPQEPIFAGVLDGWVPSDHPSVAKALSEQQPIAIYFWRGNSLPWAEFEANVLGSQVVRQKLGGIVRVVENLDNPKNPALADFGKNGDRMLTVVGSHRRSIARFNENATPDQVAYALSLL